MADAHPKRGAVAMKKSKRIGTFGLSYCIPPFSTLKMFKSFMVVPVTRHINAWLRSCTTVPGKRKVFKTFDFRYFDHSFLITKLMKS